MKKMIVRLLLISLMFGFSPSGFSQSVRFTELTDSICPMHIWAMKNGSGYLSSGLKDNIPFLMRLDPFGGLIWMKEYPLLNVERFGSMQDAACLMPDGGVLFAEKGNTYPFSVTRVDSTGEVIWSKAYFTGDTSLSYAQVGGLDVDERGNFLLTGNCQHAIILAGDANGNVKWSHCVMLTPGVMPQIGPILFNGRSAYTAVGGCGGYPYSAVNVYQADSSGHLSSQYGIQGQILSQTIMGHDGKGTIMMSEVDNEDGSYSLEIMQLDSGNQHQHTGFFPAYTDMERLNAFQKTPDGGYILLGRILFFSNAGMGTPVRRIMMMKTDSLLNTSWTRSYSYPSPGITSQTSVSIDRTGYIGVSDLLVKTDSLGFSGCGDSTISTSLSIADFINDPTPSSSSYYIDTLTIFSSVLPTSAVLDPFSPGYLCNTGIQESEKYVFEVSIFPNPFSDYLTINLERNSGTADILLYDVMGRIVFTQKFSGITAHLNTSSLAPGIYFLNIRESDGFCMKKVVKY
jgi:hypothetical protein